jgi:hypothetical protein
MFQKKGQNSERTRELRKMADCNANANRLYSAKRRWWCHRLLTASLPGSRLSRMCMGAKGSEIWRSLCLPGGSWS